MAMYSAHSIEGWLAAAIRRATLNVARRIAMQCSNVCLADGTVGAGTHSGR